MKTTENNTPITLLDRLMQLADHWKSSAALDFAHSPRRHQLLECADQLDLVARNWVATTELAAHPLMPDRQELLNP